MTTHDIKDQLNKARSWHIVLTQPKNELKIRKILERQGLITHLPLTPVKRRWGDRIKEIHIPAVARCVFVYVSPEEMNILRNHHPILPLEVL